MLLTGTFKQFRRLVPSVENGYFSRLNMLVLRDQPAFDETVFCPGEKGAEVQHLIARLSQQVLRLHQSMTTNIEFRLTESQASRIGAIMKKEYAALLQKLGSGFHATIIRNGVTLMRIAAILTALRKRDGIPLGIADLSGADNAPFGTVELYCSEEDFQTAVVIATKLLHHAAEAYQQIGGTEQTAVPEQKGTYQKEVFLATLPEEFTTGECVENAKSLGISERTAKYWITHWVEDGSICKSKYGQYSKVA